MSSSEVCDKINENHLSNHQTSEQKVICNGTQALENEGCVENEEKPNINFEPPSPSEVPPANETDITSQPLNSQILVDDSKNSIDSDERIVSVEQTGRKFEQRRNFLQRLASIEDEWIDDSSDHMFIRGIPKPNTNFNKMVKQIVTRFNGSLGTPSVETKTQLFADTRTTTSVTFSSARSKLMAKAVENATEIERSRMPWTADRRMKFRISSLSRDVPVEQPDLHREFVMDETIRLATNQSSAKGAESLLHFLEKCIVKNQN